MDPITDKQFRYIRHLVHERYLTSKQTGEPVTASERKEILAKVGSLSKREAHQWIDRLKALPFVVEESARQQGMTVQDITSPEKVLSERVSHEHSRWLAARTPEGRYAIRWENGETRFYKVDRPTEGKWAGWVFVKVQASDDFYPIKGWENKRRILEKIAEDPESASKDYGKQIGRCGICGRTLTDDDSRAAGIGPICAGKVGW